MEYPFRDCLDKVAVLIDEVGPEREPYKLKYEAANHLDSLLRELSNIEEIYTLDLQAIAYALKGKIYAETDEPANAVDFLTTAVVYFLSRFQDSNLIEKLSVHSLLSGFPSFLSSKPPVQTTEKFTSVWSTFAENYNNYLKLTDVINPQAHQASRMHDKLMANFQLVEDTPQLEVDPSAPTEGYMAGLADGLSNMNTDVLTDQPDDVFITEAITPVKASDDVQHEAPPKFDLDQTRLRLSGVIDMLSCAAPPLTKAMMTQLLPFYILTLNYLGVIWANREKKQLAISALKAAEYAMKLFDYGDPFLIKQPLIKENGEEVNTHMLYLPDSSHPFFQKTGFADLSPLLPVCNSNMISSLNTYTMYFLAQVYGEESPCQSAEYCGITISRQFDQRKLNFNFNPQDFIINCLTLQKYYTTNSLFKSSFTLINVAEQVLLEFGPTERASYIKELPNNENISEEDAMYLKARFAERMKNLSTIREALELETARELLAQIRTEHARLYSQLLADSYQRLELFLEARREELKLQYTSSETITDKEKEQAHKQIYDSCRPNQDKCVHSLKSLHEMLISSDLESTLADAANRQFLKLNLKPERCVDADSKANDSSMHPEVDNIILSESLVRTLFYDAYRQFVAASKYFVLDGFVTDHCQILLDISTLHQVYGYFEEARLNALENKALLEGLEKPDYVPLSKLYMRRCTMLDKIIPELSRDHYSKLIASLQLEVAEARTAVYRVVSRDIQNNPRLKRLTEDMEYAAQLHLKQIDPLPEKDVLLVSTSAAHCSRAIEAWRAVCKTYEADAHTRLLQEHHFKRKSFSHEEVLNFLTFEDRDSMQNCIFEAAKLLSQLPTLNPVTKHGLLADSLHCFEQVRKLWADNESLHKKEISLQLIGTTIDLLREKIGRIANVIKDYKLGSLDSKA